MSGASRALRAALVARLRADATLLALLGGARVFAHVPDRQTSPYVQLSIESKPWDTTTDYGAEHDVSFHAWTEHEGPKQAETIIDAIEASLRGATFSLAGHALVNIERRRSLVFRDGEGQTYCGFQSWRVVTEEI
jgi:hypothetical protein